MYLTLQHGDACMHVLWAIGVLTAAIILSLEASLQPIGYSCGAHSAVNDAPTP